MNLKMSERPPMNLPDMIIEKAVPVILTQNAQQLASRFAAEQPTKEKATKVYNNTLAVLAVKNYLQILDIPTSVSGCDSWNTFSRMTKNVADLEIRNYGKVECCVIPEKQSEAEEVFAHVSSEVTEERIAYLFIKLVPEQKMALLLGYLPIVESEKMTLSSLNDMEDFPTFLLQKICLSDWLLNQVQKGWKALEELLDKPDLTYQWRGADIVTPQPPDSSKSYVVRGKLIKLSRHESLAPFLLIVDIHVRLEQDYSIMLAIEPNSNQEFLPSELELFLLDSNGEAVMQAQARQENRRIQLEFLATLGDSFDLKLQLGDSIHIEKFII